MRSSSSRPEHVAAPPRPPQPGRAMERARERYRLYREEREQGQRRSLVRGLVVLALLALGFSMARAGPC